MSQLVYEIIIFFTPLSPALAILNLDIDDFPALLCTVITHLLTARIVITHYWKLHSDPNPSELP